jgi:hypothetical protein
MIAHEFVAMIGNGVIGWQRNTQVLEFANSKRVFDITDQRVINI